MARRRRRHGARSGSDGFGPTVWRRWGPALAVAAPAVLVYLTAFPGDLLSDAQAAITQNRPLRESREWLAWFGRDFYWGSTLTDYTLYRPFTVLSFVAQLRSTGLAAWPFVAVNVALHAGVSLLVLRLGTRLVGPVAALAGALLFAVHPIHAEAVAWVMGRSELLAALFGLAACLAALRASDPAERHPERFALGAVATYLAASLSKEHVALLPAWLLLPWLLRTLRSRDLRPPRAIVWLAAGSVAALGVFLFLRSNALTRLDAGEPVQQAHTRALYNPMAEASAPLRWLTAAAVLWRYAALLVWPARLSHSYSYAEVRVSEGPGAAEVGGLLLIAGLLLAAGFAARGAPGLSLALVLAPVTFFAVSNFPFAIGTGIAERLFYLPSAGLCLAAGWGLAWLGFPAALVRWVEPGRSEAAMAWRWLPGPAKPAGGAPWRRWAAAGILAVAVAGLSARTLVANLDWQSAYARASADLAAAPSSATSHSSLAWEEAKRGNLDRALELVEASLRIYPNSPSAAGTLGDILLRRGQAAAAAEQYERALQLAPGHLPFRVFRGRALTEAGRFEEAERELRDALRAAPAEYEAHLFLGNVLLRTGRPAEARQHLDLAARLEPKASMPLVGLAVAALQLGDHRAAARYGRGAERRGQRMPDSFWNAVGATREEPPRAGGTSDGR